MADDPINPNHYKSHPSGVECVDVAEWLSFNLGNALKYVWRAGQKGDAREDLVKAAWYLRRGLRWPGAEMMRVVPADLHDVVDRVIAADGGTMLSTVLRMLFMPSGCGAEQIRAALAAVEGEIARRS